MTGTEMITASEMWISGVVGWKIAAHFGISEGSFWTVTKNNRDRFPKRDRWFSERAGARLFAPDTSASDRTKWTTHSGAVVTLPRIRFLEGRG